MADCVIYAVSGEIIKNNNSVVAVMANGTVHSYQHGFNDVTSHDDLDTRYDTKFDNPTYYSN